MSFTSKGVINIDDSGKPVLALWDDATNQVVPVHIKSKVTGADGKTYAVLDISVSNVNPNGQSTMANSAPVVIASDQSAIPVKASKVSLFSTTQTAQGTGNSGDLDVSKSKVVIIDVNIT